MPFDLGADDTLRALRREVAFVCDADGTVVAACDASARIGLRPGVRLDTWAGASASVVQEAIARAARGEIVEGVAIEVRDGDAAAARYVLRARRHPLGVAVVGSAVEGSADAADLHAQIALLSQELEDSNRGVMALYAELDDSASQMRRTADVKSRLVSNVSHEFRTPLNSILGLSKLLLDRADGELTPEQERQVRYVRGAAEQLSALVNDMLDLSRAESGKETRRLSRFSADEFLSSLRGTMRPLVAGDGPVTLVIEPATVPFSLETDEGKLSQILRNLVSNAIKFTERGEVRVTCERSPDGEAVFRVADTGIGIRPEHHDLVFEEFAQIESPAQGRHKGTGLGLAIARRLAGVLGGDLTFTSTYGKGTTFTLAIPAIHADATNIAHMLERSRVIDPARAPVLVVEDDAQTLYLYEKYLSGSGFQVIPARTVDDAREQLTRFRPAAIVLDIMLENETTWTFLNEIKSNDDTREIPALVVTITNREQKARALGADEFWLKPVDRSQLLGKLRQLARSGPVSKVLVVDDDEVSRYVLRHHLADTRYDVIEAESGGEGLARARSELPELIVLDFVLPDMTAFDVIDELKCDPRTRAVPIVLYTGKKLDDVERARLEQETNGILSKQGLSRELAITRIRDALTKAGVQEVRRGSN